MKRPVKKMLKRHPHTGQLKDPKTGRWLPKPGKTTKPIEAGKSVMDILASRADPAKIAKTLERRAYAG